MSYTKLVQQKTPYQDLNRVLSQFVGEVRNILRDALVGVYLQGSFAVGDFDLHSDVDWIVVVRSELTEDQLANLQEMHKRIYNINSRWARHLEGSYFPIDVLNAAPQQGEELWFLNNGASFLERSDHCNRYHVRFVVREQGVALFGPDSETLVPPVLVQDLRTEIYESLYVSGVKILEDSKDFNNRFYQAFLVLNYCRMLHDLYRGQVGSKLAGSAWVISSGLAGEWADLIDRSWARRTSPANSVSLPADPVDFEATLAFVRHIMALAQEFMESK